MVFLESRPEKQAFPDESVKDSFLQQYEMDTLAQIGATRPDLRVCYEGGTCW